MRPASAKGWRVAEVAGLPYPGLVADDDIADDALITDLTADEWTLLDAFENPAYEVLSVDVEDDGQAYAYVCGGELQPLDSRWDRQQFESIELTSYLERCATWRQRYNGSGVTP
jgi:hypothetical protein